MTSFNLANARSTDTAMRDLLRHLERQTVTPPMRPRPWPEEPAEAISGSGIRIGAWVLTEEPETGDLVATNDDGTQRTVATKGIS